MIINKDYAEPSPIQIRVYENKMEIVNGGVLPDGWTVETLLTSHRSFPYNPGIANAFFRSREIEAHRTYHNGLQERRFLDAGVPLRCFGYLDDI